MIESDEISKSSRLVNADASVRSSRSVKTEQDMKQGHQNLRKRVLLIGGAVNQTRIAHAVAQQLEDDYDCWFSPCYADSGFVGLLDRAQLLEWTALGGVMRSGTLDYLAAHGLQLDDGGRRGPYDLVVATTDLIVPRNIRSSDIVLVQEGMTDPENLLYHLVRRARLPRYLASTASFGESHRYRYLCAASDGYKDKFVRKGINPERIVVTGLPHWDDLERQAVHGNRFPYRNYVLVATSDTRETFKFDRRKRFLRRCVEIASGRSLIFKLHPNENADRSSREIASVAPEALIFTDGDINHMIAHCDALITQYSTVAYVGLALGKECHSYFDIEELETLQPIQNKGASASAIAAVCREVLDPATHTGRNRLVDICQCRDCRSVSYRLHTTAG